MTLAFIPGPPTVVSSYDNPYPPARKNSKIRVAENAPATDGYVLEFRYSPVKEQICGRILNEGLSILRTVYLATSPGLVEVLNGNLHPTAHIKRIPQDEIC